MKQKKDDAAVAEKKSNNVVGKINNLVTSDLDSIMSGRDFLFIGGECARAAAGAKGLMDDSAVVAAEVCAGDVVLVRGARVEVCARL